MKKSPTEEKAYDLAMELLKKRELEDRLAIDGLKRAVERPLDEFAVDDKPAESAE